VVALTHDLGYPIKKIGKINKSIQSILPYFHVRTYKEFDFGFDHMQQAFIDDFISVQGSFSLFISAAARR